MRKRTFEAGADAYRGLPATARGWRLLFAIQWSITLAGLVALAVVVTLDGGDVLLRVLLPMGIILFLISLAWSAVASAYLFARVRARSLHRLLPDATVFSVQLDRSSIAWLREAGASSDLATSKNWTATITANSSRIGFWIGIFSPVLLLELDWDKVPEISVGEKLSMNSAIPAICLLAAWPSESLVMPLIPARFPLISAPSKETLGELVNQPDSLRQR